MPCSKTSAIKCSKMTNKPVIIKAIKEVCLAGRHYTEIREKIIDVIDKCDSDNFIILFKNNEGFYLKAVYTFDPNQLNFIQLLTCIGNSPDIININEVLQFFKFNISKKQFIELKGNKEFNVIIDGIIINKI